MLVYMLSLLWGALMVVLKGLLRAEGQEQVLIYLLLRGSGYVST